MTTQPRRAPTPGRLWRTWLVVAAGAVMLYAGVLVVDGARASALFDALGFGPADGGVAAEPLPDHLRLVYGVLGAVLVGWFVLVTAIAAGPLRRGERWAARALGLSVGTWFVVDTGFSLAVGEWQHALFNLPFALVLAVPLAALALAPAPAPGETASSGTATSAS